MWCDKLTGCNSTVVCPLTRLPPATCPLLPATKVCTKYCVFSGREMATLNKAAVKAAVDLSRQRLGVNKIDLMQLYWADYSYPK